MSQDRSKIFWVVYLLQIAGFLVMAGFGFLGMTHFLSGALLYLFGVFLCNWVSEKQDLQSLGFLNLLLFLINIVWYSSAKIASFGDVSFYIYLLGVANLAWLSWLFAVKRERRLLNFPYLKPAIFFLAAVALSAISASHVKDVLYFFLLNAGAYLVFLSLVNLGFPWAEKIVALAKTLVLLGVVSAAAAVWQLYSGSFKFLYYPFINERDQLILEKWEAVSRVAGTWQHPSYLGIYLAALIPLTVYLIFYLSRRFSHRVFWAMALVFMTSVLLLTNTRSSVLAGFFGMAVMFFLVNPHPFRLSLDVRKAAVLGLLAAAALLVYQFVYVAEIYSKPQAWRVDASATIWGRFLRADTMSTESLVQRSKLYELAWRTYLSRPFFGVGAKNFQYEVEKTFGTGTDGHNLILQTAAETGIVGILAILGLYGAVLTTLYKYLPAINEPRLKYLYAALLGTVVLVLFDSLFNNPLYSLRIVAVFWIVIALQYNIYRFQSTSG